MVSVLFVDDESALRRAVQRWLEKRGAVVHTARSVRSAKRCFGLHRLDGAFLDVWLGDGTGFDLYDWVREHHPYVADRIVFLTGDIVPSPLADERLQASGRQLITKPFELPDLDRLVAQWGAAAARERGEHRARAPRAPPPDEGG